MSNKAAELKALRRQDDTERRRILSQLAEDKAEREQRRQAAVQDPAAQDPAAQGPTPPGKGAAGPSSTAGGPSTTTALLVRTAEGALRASFSADSTLLDVRAWVDESCRVTAASAMSPPRPVVGGGRVLVSTEQTEALRAGREFFEQQTARMREEARSSRAALDAGGGGTDRRGGGGKSRRCRSVGPSVRSSVPCLSELSKFGFTPLELRRINCTFLFSSCLLS